MDTVNNLLEGASPYQVLQEQAGKLAGKWDRSGLLEGIESSTEKNNMAMLFCSVEVVIPSKSPDLSHLADNLPAWSCRTW